MENHSTVFAGATREIGPFDRVSQLPEDLLLMGMPPVNLLLTGGDESVGIVLETLLGELHEPIARWSPGQPLMLPPYPQPGTMILHHVGAMVLEDQLQLLEWLERDVGRTKVVSTTRSPLMPLVEAGLFNDMLYYRLNTVSVDVTA